MEQLERRADVRDHAGAMKVVWKYMAISSGAGLIQVPVLDVSALAGVHVALIKALADYYGVEFSHHTAKAILIAIGASLVPGTIGSVLGRRALAAIPFLTPFGGLLTMSAFSAAVSYRLAGSSSATSRPAARWPTSTSATCTTRSPPPDRPEAELKLGATKPSSFCFVVSSSSWFSSSS